MQTQFSIDYRLNEGLQNRGMPVQAFASLAELEGIRFASKSKLFDAFAGRKSLQNETAEALWSLWLEIETLCRSFEPYRLDLSDGPLVHQWLASRRETEFGARREGCSPMYACTILNSTNI
jgi:hypothetical protein